MFLCAIPEVILHPTKNTSDREFEYVVLLEVRMHWEFSVRNDIHPVQFTIVLTHVKMALKNGTTESSSYLDDACANNNNNGYLERLTRKGPKRLHIL